LRHLRWNRPGVARSWLTCARTVSAAPLWWDGDGVGRHSGSIPRAVAAEGGPVWGPDHVGLDEQQVAEAHALGLEVVPWTVNRPEDMARLIAWGVDGLITDRPDLARHVLTAHA
jgi:glycerophosphoryl diester phosphodiesterase